MTLEEYIKSKNKRINQCAVEMNVSYMALSRWIRGIRIPRTENMRRIVEWSQGEVQPQDFYDFGEGER